MIYLSDVKDFLKSFNLFEHYYIGKLDNKQDNSLGVYQNKLDDAPGYGLSGELTYSIIGVQLLVHCTNNAEETEKTAYRLYNKLRTVKNIKINNHIIYLIELLDTAPIDVGTDDKGVYEYVINLKLYFERKDD